MTGASASNRKISWLSREDESGTLDLSPAFQRRLVWSETQASYLIDTILLGLPFPEIYIRSATTPEGKTSYEVIDGQQRIQAILDFARNDLTLVGDEVSPRLHGIRFEDLSDAEKKAFWDYDVVTRELHEVSEGDIRDLFRRLNISAVNLNDQELRHARFTGYFMQVTEELADDDWWLEHKVVTVRQIRRMEDVEFVAELLIACMAGPQDKKKTIDDFYIDLDADFPDRANWMRRFHQTRTLLERIMTPEQIKAWSGKSDFYSLFHVLHGYVEAGVKWSPAQRTKCAQQLATLRTQVDQAKRKDNATKFPQYVMEYADAVSRAASDAARRKVRATILKERIDKSRV